MTTANDLTNAANSLLNFIRARNSSIQSLETRFVALGQPTAARQPDALANFNRLVSERDVESKLWNENTQYTSFIQLYNSAPESAKTDAVKALKKNVVEEANGLIELGRNQRNTTIPATRQAIQDALRGVAPNDTPIQPPQPPPPPEGGGPQGPSAPNPNLPGRRLKNPLGWFSSYTYQLTLYMVNPQGYNAFVDNGQTSVPNTGSAIIAQSGGTPTNRRPQNMPFDYYIDNLKVKQVIAGKDSGTPTGISDISFTITEPYGFSLITKLRDISAGLMSSSTGGFNTDGAKLNNPLKQFFIIGVRFYGYDAEGNIMRGDNEYNGMQLDPNWQGTSEGAAVFERYLSFQIREFKFKIDGKATIYNISGASSGPAAAAGVKRGALNKPLEIQVKTVREALQQLMDKLNADGQALVDDKKIKYRNNYKVFGINDGLDRAEYPLPQGLDVIFNSSMVTPENANKQNSSNGDAKNITEVNEKKGASATPNNTAITVKFNKDTPVLQLIGKIITQSTYLRDGLTEVYKSKVEPNDQRTTDNYNKPDTQKRVRWYTVSPQVSDGKYDPNTGDYAYEILYIIRPYETPVVTATYADKTTPYYGAHKRYDYWYTGQNSEIIAYEQQFNLLYFQIAANPAADTSGKGTQGGQSSAQPRGPNNADRQGVLDQGLEAQNNYITSLFDPGAYTDVKMTILGDPDYWMQDTESTTSLNEAYRRHYGTNGFSINPNGGQVFVEVDFKEAIDYDTNKGFMDINESIQFWKYPPNIARKVKGVSYLLKTVNHSFQNGKFTQVLEMTINTFGDAMPPPPPQPTGPTNPGGQ